MNEAPDSRNTDDFLKQLAKEVLAIDEHIGFASELISRNKWSGKQKVRMQERLDAIKRKQADKCLNISVIGEFSSGKSSFINALVGEDILVSGVLQGTTVAATIIEYSRNRNVQVFFKNDRQPIVHGNLSTLEAAKIISRYSTGKDGNKDVKYVKVGLPQEKLASGLRIIDTPGTNSLISWHEEVTSDVLRNMSDMSIILTDATKPMPESLLSFMDEALNDIYAQCSVMVTKIDLLAARDREDILDFVRKKMRSLPGGEKTLVTSYCAMAVSGERNGEQLLEKKQRELALESLENERLLFRHTDRYRKKALVNSLIKLVKVMYSDLDAGMRERQKKVVQRLDFYRKSRKTPLAPFIEKQKSVRIEQFKTLCEYQRNNLELISGQLLDNSSQELTLLINSPKTYDGLKELFKKEFQAAYKEKVENLLAVYEAFGAEQLKAYSTVMNTFHGEFKKEFERLNIFQLPLSELSLKPEIQTADLYKSMEDAKRYVFSANGDRSGNYYAGALLGVIAGSILLPGFGTLIGGVLGSYIAGKSTKKLDEIKKNAVQKAKDKLEEVYKTVDKEAMERFDDNCEELAESFKKQLDAYVEEYNKTVDNKIAKYNRLESELERESLSIMDDLNALEAHRSSLDAVYKVLNSN